MTWKTRDQVEEEQIEMVWPWGRRGEDGSKGRAMRGEVREEDRGEDRRRGGGDEGYGGPGNRRGHSGDERPSPVQPHRGNRT